ncbi:MAG: AAA family ATPase [Clostridioides sp.]|jgi:AAA15 family ATPase/GTPase|nr:AAA family ATPase [Clostridioides sp.]
MILKSVKMKNFLSYKDETLFTMEATEDDEYDELNTFEDKTGKYLKSTLIFGANASGKTNLINAIDFLKEAINTSILANNSLKHLEPFKFDKKNTTEPITLEISVIIDEDEYRYGFAVLDNAVIREWFLKNEDRLFERISPSWEDIEVFEEFNEAEPIKRFTRKNALFISTTSALNELISMKFVAEITGGINILRKNKDLDQIKDTMEYMEKNPSVKNSILEYLKKTDTGIEGLDCEEMNTIHNVYDNSKKVDEIRLSFMKYQSSGVKKLFIMLGPIFKTLSDGSVLLIDEIDSRLHPSIVRMILSMYNSIDLNPKKAQLICSTHDVLLLDGDIRSDQVWFTEKNKYGATELYSLADFEGIDKKDSILKSYLLGIYGAVPKRIYLSDMNMERGQGDV